MTPDQCVRLLNDLATKVVSDPELTPEKLGAAMSLVYGLTSACLEQLWLDDVTRGQLPN